MEGTKKEQDMWVQRKSAEQWRYNKLMSEGADAYRQSENLVHPNSTMKRRR